MEATQLTFDAADRLVDLVEERRGPVAAGEAARALFALASAPAGLARSLLDDVVSGDARLAWRGSAVGLADDPAGTLPLEAARYVVVDLETTGLRPGRASICEIGAVRLEGLTKTGTFQTLVDPGVPLPPIVISLTGIEDRDLTGAPTPLEAVRRFLDFASGAVLVAHNARFDIGFLDREVELIEGRRLAAPVIDTVGLARRLLAGRVARASLGSLAHFFGTSVRPSHRALPDAEATAEILLCLIGLAQERGARTVADLGQLAAPRARRVYDKRALAFGAPSSPGVYLFVGKGEQILYVGRARNLRERLRSYFRGERQRPAVEAALAAVERIEWRVLGSELESALEELRLIREERPPANARSARPDRYVYFARRGERIVVTSAPSPLGPIRSRRRAELAARALQGASESELALLSSGGPLPRLRAKLHGLAECLRYEDAARLRDRIAALEQVVQDLAELDRLRAARLCIIAPAVEEGFRRAFFVSAGRVAAVRTLPRGPTSRIELEAGLAEAAACSESLAPEDADELLLIGSFLRRPAPELQIVRLTDLERGYSPGDERGALAAADAR
ncbi:MAG TPA: exonuclease domain-containing protein [Gaiellaceae bacterium]|nr:exonuclease domain-containing protein [Gaiellaceae bacterium]